MEYLTLVYRYDKSDELATARFDGLVWVGNKKIKDQPGGIKPKSATNPGVAVFNNWFYIAYPGENLDQLYTSWFNGREWKGNIKVKDQNGGISPLSTMSPGLAAYHGTLFAAYKNNSWDSGPLYSSWFDGTTWYGDKKIKDQPGGVNAESQYTPRTIQFRNKLYIIYMHDDTYKLRYAWFDDLAWHGGLEIETKNGTPETTSPPGVAVYKDRLYLFYKGKHSSSIYFAYFDGDEWKGNEKIEKQSGGIKPKSMYSPSAAVFRNKLYIAYRGSNSRDIYTAWYDGGKWHGNEKISKQPGGISPRSQETPSLCVGATWPEQQARWMRDVNDRAYIGELNIPGTHDSAAINTSTSTPYACHNYSITSQLESGIRLLDVRLQVIAVSGGYEFYTCHGDRGSKLYLNTYQSFPSLLEECKNFVENHASEVIVMSLKIDDYSGLAAERSAILDSLENLIELYPIVRSSELTRLGDVRGKFFLYNRITTDLRFGCPISWHSATDGRSLPPTQYRDYNVYVQDKWEHLPATGTRLAKFDLVKNAIGQAGKNPVVLNFANAVTSLGFGVYVMGDLLAYLGERPASTRPPRLGWILFDYELTFYETDKYGAMNAVDIMISSNFGYRDYPEPFRVTKF
ncbi:MAG: hypothetical protein JJ864_17990 [Rhizobiaceae bacterium]|nr:hypothetical protein [Rhizobiaceae bacterium]